MYEILYEVASSAVSLEHVFISSIISIIASATVGIVIGKMSKSIKGAAVAAIINEVLLIVLFFSIRDGVQKHRLKVITSMMSEIPLSVQKCKTSGKHISNYREGLELIKLCPTEVGYYLRTADLLMRERDYESAATLIELGLDFLPYDPIPIALCERLNNYYKHLRNRPRLDSACIKYHDVEAL